MKLFFNHINQSFFFRKYWICICCLYVHYYKYHLCFNEKYCIDTQWKSHVIYWMRKSFSSKTFPSLMGQMYSKNVQSSMQMKSWIYFKINPTKTLLCLSVSSFFIRAMIIYKIYTIVQIYCRPHILQINSPGFPSCHMPTIKAYLYEFQYS